MFFERLRWKKKSTNHSKQVLVSRCLRLPLMSEREYSAMSAVLESAHQWYTGSSLGSGGHFVSEVKSSIAQDFYLSQLGNWQQEGRLPVLLTNCHENMVDSIRAAGERVGIIHISHRFALEPTLELTRGSCYHYVLSRNPQAEYLALGIDPGCYNVAGLDHAEDMGAYWLSNAECNLRSRGKLKDQLSHLSSRVDYLILDIDLASVVPSHRYGATPVLDAHWLDRVIGFCHATGKLSMVQLCGQYEYQLFSRQAKHLIDMLCPAGVLSDQYASTQRDAMQVS